MGTEQIEDFEEETKKNEWLNNILEDTVENNLKDYEQKSNLAINIFNKTKRQIKNSLP